MIVISTGGASHQDISAGYVVVATLGAPTSGGAEYLLQIRLRDLDPGAGLVLKQDQGAPQIYYTGQAVDDGLTNRIIELRRSMAAGEANCVVSIKDDAGPSTDATWLHSVYRVDEQEIEQPQYLVPKNATGVPLLFRIGQTSPASPPTVTLMKNGAATFTAASGTVTVLASGWCKLDPDASDTSTEGPLVLRAVSGNVTRFSTYQIFSDTAAVEFATAVSAELADDFQEVLDAISAADVPGGSQPWSILVKDDNGDPLDNAEVWITTDEAGEHVVDGRIYSSANGLANFLLDSGDYFAWAEHGGKVRIMAQAFTVP